MPCFDGSGVSFDSESMSRFLAIGWLAVGMLAGLALALVVPPPLVPVGLAARQNQPMMR
jgi:hypothetical protein